MEGMYLNKRIELGERERERERDGEGKEECVPVRSMF